jgi:hypothetical protein
VTLGRQRRGERAGNGTSRAAAPDGSTSTTRTSVASPSAARGTRTRPAASGRRLASTIGGAATKSYDA